MMNLAEDIIKDLDLGRFLSQKPISGGSINDAYQIETTKGKFFLKLNNANRYPNMFQVEQQGLELLGHSSFVVPKPRNVGVRNGTQFILMDWIEHGSPNHDFWEVFGRRLAELHQLSAKKFGLSHDNYIGSLPQGNTEHDTWAAFYRDERLIPQIKLAEKNGQLTSKMKRGFDALFNDLDSLFPKEKPSLLHGDLWSGNMMIAQDGSPCIFDPAVYYGHREMDLAMMALFGGFGESWVDAYNEVYQLESGWRERIEIGQLYPLMVHVNLFSGSYASSVESILKQFV